MINFESFISEEITLALKHPLAQNLELPIPDANTASLQEILEFQQHSRLTGVVKPMIPLDADTLDKIAKIQGTLPQPSPH